MVFLLRPHNMPIAWLIPVVIPKNAQGWHRVRPQARVVPSDPMLLCTSTSLCVFSRSRELESWFCLAIHLGADWTMRHLTMQFAGTVANRLFLYNTKLKLHLQKQTVEPLAFEGEHAGMICST